MAPATGFPNAVCWSRAAGRPHGECRTPFRRQRSLVRRPSTQSKRNVPILSTLSGRGSRGSAGRSAVRVAGGLGAVAVTSAALLASAVGASASTRTRSCGLPRPARRPPRTRNCATARYSTVQSAVTAAETFEAAHPFGRASDRAVPGYLPGAGDDHQEPGHYPCPGARPRRDRAARHSRGVHDELPGQGHLRQAPQSVVEICAAAAGGANTRGVSVVDQRGHRPG